MRDGNTNLIQSEKMREMGKRYVKDRKEICERKEVKMGEVKDRKGKFKGGKMYETGRENMKDKKKIEISTRSIKEKVKCVKGFRSAYLSEDKYKE